MVGSVCFYGEIEDSSFDCFESVFCSKFVVINECIQKETLIITNTSSVSGSIWSLNIPRSFGDLL